MLKPLIRTIDRWRFELPLALVLGAAAAFATIVMPSDLFGRLPGVTGSGFATSIQNAVAALVGFAALLLGYLVMRRPKPRAVELEIEDEKETVDPAIVERLVRLRRADLHPDAPPRQPIRASRDLGEPFMEIGGFEAGIDAPDPAILDGEYVELDPPAPVATAFEVALPEEPAPPVVPEPVAKAVRASESFPIAEAVLPIEAFKPEADPVPVPVRAVRPSLGSMMERLTAGLENRGGRPVSPPPAAVLAEALVRPRESRPELRDALEELNRLAGRHD